MARKSIGIGVIGGGYMGLTYCECIARSVTDCHLVAVVGGRRSAELAASYGVDAPATPEELFERQDVEAVILATPDQYRMEHACKAAAHGEHVLAEKPMAPTVAACEEMIAACSAASVNLAVVKTERERDISRKTRHLVDSGAVGDIRMLRTVSTFPLNTTKELFRNRPWMLNSAGGGFFMSMACHNVDFIRWITGQEITRVTAFGHGYSDLQAGVLSVMAQFELDGGLMAQMFISSELPDPGLPHSDFRFEIIGDRGIIDVDNYEFLRLGTGESWEVVYEPAKFDYLNDPKSVERLVPHARVVQEFVDSIQESRPPRVGGGDGKAAVQVCEACLASIRSGEAVHLDPQ